MQAWSHVWRVALVLLIAAAGWAEISIWQWLNNRPWFFLDASLGLAALALVFWRRRSPLAVALATSATTVISASAGGPATLALVSLATRRRWREIVPAAIVSVAAGGAFIYLNPTDDGEPWLVFLTAIASIIGVSVGWGMFIGSRRELLATLRDRADRAESEQTARITQARSAERARLAREMHDVLAHRISLVSMHAGALAYRSDLAREEVRATSEIIQQSAHLALVDLRRVLGVLREGPGDASPERPQPGLSDLPELIAEARRHGMNLRFVERLSDSSVGEPVGRTVYRVVQEALTNARKHAPDTAVTIEVSGSPDDGIHVTVRNPLRIGEAAWRTPSGLGLIGLTERAELSGGTLDHTITSQGEFVLRVWLPWAP